MASLRRTNSRTHLDEVAHRRREVDKITAFAAQSGLAVTVDIVAKHYLWFMRWHMGLISTGQLMGRTGVKFKPRVTITRKAGGRMDGTTFMADMEGSSAGVVPPGFAYVAGYVSGSDGVAWTDADWARFITVRKVRIYQGHGAVPDLHSFNAIDVESEAVTPQSAADIVRDRVAAGIQWTTIYGTDSTLAAVAEAVKAYGETVWNGHVNAWLADWNLSHATSVPLIGSSIHGMTCVAVQWASPTSNPNTTLPGTTLNLKSANVDISTVDNTWIPGGGWGVPTVAVPPPTQTTIEGVVVMVGSGATKRVASTDGGTTWH